MTKIMTGAQCRAARALLDWSVRELADRSSVHRNTISSFESGKTHPNPSTIHVLAASLQTAGVEFIDQNGGGPGVRLR